VSGNFSSHNNNVKRAFCDSPLISIITVVYNGQEFLEETILSIANQTYQGIEYIIIDGGSSDGTVDIIKKYEHVIDSWVSESDEGIYDAMNKGAKLATGSHLGFLNASDMYFTDAIQHVVNAISKNDFDYCFAPAIVRTESGQDIFTAHPIHNFVYQQGQYMGMPAPHISTFIKVQVFRAMGGYDLSFLLSSDFDLLLRLTKDSQNMQSLEQPIGAFRLGGVSGSYKTHIDNFYVFKKHKMHFLRRLFVVMYFTARTFLAKNLSTKMVKYTQRYFRKTN
tara:strand:- start:1450 stop:2286 length:837 start_codon:yes stop_codon:yes gene_type:complete